MYTSNDGYRSGALQRPVALASPWSEGELSKFIYSDVFGGDYAPLTRADALSIPAVSKARNLIAGTIAKLPLKAADKNGLLPDDKQPTWTYRTDGVLSPFMRMLNTIDDLLFYGHSLWLVQRGSRNEVLDAQRVPYARWGINAAGELLVDDKPIDESQIIYFPGPTTGLLDKDGATLRGAINVGKALESRAKTPIPAMEISQTQDIPLTQDEAKALVTGYNKARRDPDGATVFTPYGIELVPHGEQANAGFMTDGRNAIRLDVANITGVPVAMLDGSTTTASLTYSTQEGQRNEFVDYGLVLWMEAITGRLSADDVVPRGQRIVFDQTDFLTTLPSPIGPDLQD